MKKSFLCFLIGVVSFVVGPRQIIAEEAAYQIDAKVVSVSELYKEDPNKFYELEKEKYETISKVAEEKYFQHYWTKLGASEGVNAKDARDNYFNRNIKITEKQVNQALLRFKDHPRLKNVPLDVQKSQVEEYLSAIKTQEINTKIIDEAKKSGEFVVLYPKPKEPRYEIKILETDPIRYGPKPSDIKPMGCSDNCTLTIVEYSEFECPHCMRVQKTVNKILGKFKGKIRLVAKDYPLEFHDRSKPAAIAARCAQNQGKYWELSALLYSSKSDLSDKYIDKSAIKIGLNMKSFKACIEKPVEALLRVKESYESGRSLGISSTPVFFVNGRRISGILSSTEFEKIISQEIEKTK